MEMGITQWESHENGNKTNLGMGIDFTGMGGNGNVKIHFRSSLIRMNRETRSLSCIAASLFNKLTYLFNWYDTNR